MTTYSSLCIKCSHIFRSDWKPHRKPVLESETGQDNVGDLPGALLDGDSYRRLNWFQSTLGKNSEIILQPFEHYNIKDLESSAGACKLCSIFWDYLSDLLPDLEQKHRLNLDRAIGFVQVRPAFDDLDDTSGEDDTEATASGSVMTLELEASYFVDGGWDSQDAFLPLTIGFDLLPADKWQDAIACIPETISAISKNTINAIGTWVAECQHEHVSCWRSAEAAFKSKLRQDMPTRVLHITTDGSNRNRVRLIETQSLQKASASSDYITLSHCWGGFLPVRLLQSNYDSFRKDIEIQNLPKTFRDAITLTQACGIKYIWIDALCIIQDSKTDWLNESLLMASVYSFAYLNIAATSAQDGHGGLFRQRNKWKLATCNVSAMWNTFPVGDYICLDSTTWERHVELAPLNKRAWVFQERLLAPRTVHFAQDQVWWECRGTRANESYFHGVPDYVLDTEGRFVEQLANIDERSRTMSNETWLHIVEKYTQAQLTKDVDRLIALAGVALVVQETLHWKREDYCAGLWKHDLAVDLLWQVNSAATRKQSAYVAPTWSWASVNGEVFFGRSDDRDIIRRNLTSKVEDVSIQTEGDEFGLVTHGALTLRARLYEATFYRPTPGPNSMMSKLKFGDEQVELEYKVHFYEDLDDERLYDPKGNAEIVSVWCVISSFTTPHLPDQYSTNGLILQEATGEGPGVYKRIGWSRLVYSDSDVDFARQFTQQSLKISHLDRLDDGFFRIKVI